MPPSLTGTLLDDTLDLNVLAGIDLGDLPFNAYFIEGVEIGIPVTHIDPGDPMDWIRGTPWRPIRGRAWPTVHGTEWRRIVK